jgi:hypothetical protein
MALALNSFKTITTVAPTSPVGIYTAPVGYTGVVLLGQATNINAQSQDVTFSHQRTSAGIAVTTRLVKNYPISASDTVNLLSGKLVLQSGDSLVLSASSLSSIEVVVSVLETLN